MWYTFSRFPGAYSMSSNVVSVITQLCVRVSNLPEQFFRSQVPSSAGSSIAVPGSDHACRFERKQPDNVSEKKRAASTHTQTALSLVIVQRSIRLPFWRPNCQNPQGNWRRGGSLYRMAALPAVQAVERTPIE